ITGRLLSPAIQEPIDVKVPGDPNKKDQHQEVKKETRGQPESIGSKKIGFGREQCQDRPSSKNPYQSHEVAELYVSFAITVDVINIPADDSSECTRAPELESRGSL